MAHSKEIAVCITTRMHDLGYVQDHVPADTSECWSTSVVGYERERGVVLIEKAIRYLTLPEIASCFGVPAGHDRYAIRWHTPSDSEWSKQSGENGVEVMTWKAKK